MGKVVNEFPRTSPDSRELKAIELIAALDNTLIVNEKHLEKRLQVVPELFEQYQNAKESISNVVVGLYETIPCETLLRLHKRNEKIEVVVRPISVLNKSTDVSVVLEEDLKTLVDFARSGHCELCIKTGVEAKKCPLRKNLLSIYPPEEIKNSYTCEYAI
jgi:hypothetical protein